MSDLVERLRALEANETELAHDGDCPPEATANWQYAETCRLAADRIAQLEAALRFYAGWPQGPAGNIAPLLIDAGYKARAALDERT